VNTFYLISSNSPYASGGEPTSSQETGSQENSSMHGEIVTHIIFKFGTDVMCFELVVAVAGIFASNAIKMTAQLRSEKRFLLIKFKTEFYIRKLFGNILVYKF